MLIIYLGTLSQKLFKISALIIHSVLHFPNTQTPFSLSKALVEIDISMAEPKQDQDKFDLDISRVNELFHYMQALHEPTSLMIIRILALQMNIQDTRNRFINSRTKPGFQEKTPIKNSKESQGSYNEFQILWKRLNDTILGGGGGSNPAGVSRDAVSRHIFGLFLTKEIEEKMGSDSSVKRLEQDLRASITMADASKDVRVKNEEGVEVSELNMQVLRRKCEEGFKKAQESGKKSLMDCVKECKKSDKLFKVLNAMKVQVAELRIELSRLIDDYMLMMSGKEQWAEKIGRFMSKLNGLSIKKIIKLPKKEKFEKRNLKKLLKIRSPIDDLIDKILDQVLNLLSDQFIVIALHLESIMSYRLHPESQDFMNVELAAYKCGLKQSKEMLKDVGENIDILKEILSSKLDCKDEKTIDDLHFMESMIVRYWNK